MIMPIKVAMVDSIFVNVHQKYRSLIGLNLKTEAAMIMLIKVVIKIMIINDTNP